MYAIKTENGYLNISEKDCVEGHKEVIEVSSLKNAYHTEDFRFLIDIASVWNHGVYLDEQFIYIFPKNVKLTEIVEIYIIGTKVSDLRGYYDETKN